MYKVVNGVTQPRKMPSDFFIGKFRHKTLFKLGVREYSLPSTLEGFFTLINVRLFLNNPPKEKVLNFKFFPAP